MEMSLEVYSTLLNGFPNVPPEAGGILGYKNGYVCCFQMDSYIPNTKCAKYLPNISYLNKIISEWAQQDICFIGIVHSHPTEQERLSGADKEYICEIMRAMPLYCDTLYFPIVIPKKRIISFQAKRIGDNIVIGDDIVQIRK